MEALMCLFGIVIGSGLVTDLWLVAKFAARNIDGESDYRDWETDRKSTRLNSSHSGESRMPSSA